MSLDRLQAAADCLSSGASLPPETSAWFGSAFERFLIGEAASVDEALGIPVLSQATRAKVKRNFWLREAMRYLVNAPGGYSASRALAKEIQRFESRVWPRWKELENAPASSPGLDRCLFTAF